jgi:hypothetical protein
MGIHERQQSNSCEVLLDLAHIAGKEEGPKILYEAWRRGLLTRSELRIVLPPIWCAPMRPEPLLGASKWVDLFRSARYCPPDEPLTIYRGATMEGRAGMSWTTEIERAQWFANYSAVATAHVFQCIAAPDAVLCQVPRTIIGELAWEENEVIVDPSRLGTLGYFDLSELPPLMV